MWPTNYLQIDLKGERGARMLSVIIGRNGTCKSTLLRTLALGLCYQWDASALIADSGGRLVREGTEQGSIVLRMAKATGEELGEIRLTIGTSGGRDYLANRETSFEYREFIVCAYGTGRGNIGTSQAHSYRTMEAVAPLFDYHRTLVDIAPNEVI